MRLVLLNSERMSDQCERALKHRADPRPPFLGQLPKENHFEYERLLLEEIEQPTHTLLPLVYFY